MQKKSKSKLCWELFQTMVKIGAFTFGGGYAMISLIENEFVSKKGWMEKEEFLDMVAIAESTPGPVAINSATYVGYKMAGVIGSASASLGVCLPSFAIIYIISLFFEEFLSLTYVGYAFKGIQVCVIYLILTAGLKLMKNLEKSVFNMAIMGAVISCMLLFSFFSVKVSSILYILVCGVIGVVVYACDAMKKRGACTR